MKILSKKLKKVSGKGFSAFPKSPLKLTLIFSLPFVLIFNNGYEICRKRNGKRAAEDRHSACRSCRP